MHVRCQYCRHSFNLNRTVIAAAVTEAKEKRRKYHGIDCPGCRKLIKIPIRQMRRFVPKTETSESEDSQQAAG